MKKAKITPTGVALIFIGVMVGWAALGGIVGLAMTRGFERFHDQEAVTAIQARNPLPPEPRLQVDPLADRQVMVAPDHRAATSGPGHTSVDQAMRALAAQGWPEANP